MPKRIINLKTSDKITVLFTLFNFISLVILLIGINIIYFFAWYLDQKEDSMYDMNKNYTQYATNPNLSNLEAFKEYILNKDTLIIPKDGDEDLICSNGVETKVHNNIEAVKDKLFYKTDDKIFFIYSQTYDEIGEVKIFFDTTPYVKSQILIIKISLIIILVSLFIYFFVGKKITSYSLRNLKTIAQKAGEIDIEKDFKKIEIIGNKDDEINILASTLNCSFEHIQKQTSNLKQFISDVSHEFKTPLMVINSNIDLYNKKLEKDKLSLDDTCKLLDKIKEKTNKLNGLLETFLHLSRIENKIEKLRKKSTDISKHIKNGSEKIIGDNKKKIEIKYNLDNEVKIKIEESSFDVLFENILSNAIKFSDEKGKIEIGNDKNSFWIKDNGIGISEEEIGKICNKFHRSDINKEGFGVGLFIVKRISQIYNWEIEIKSKKGKGTLFKVIFNHEQ